jgi:SAM-dependent methyltransferase
MTTTEIFAPERTDALVERLFDATVGTLELYSVYLGQRLGLYPVLREPVTPGELAAAAGLDARYAREWLEQQAVAGIVDVDDVAADSAERRYRLPAEYVGVLTDQHDPAHVAPFASMLVGIAGALPDVVEAYRTGAGVPYRRYGADFVHGQGGINAPAFRHELAGWVAAVPGAAQRLGRIGARVADVGCGVGASTAALARAFPAADIDGVDLDRASVAAARAAVEPELRERVRFLEGDAVDLSATGPYDFVFVFEALHDMAQPVAALAGCRAALAPGGSVLLADERVAETFTAPGSAVERMMFGWSVTHCLPASREQQPSAALGTALRPGTVGQLAAEAGFARCTELAIENEFFRFYHLVP